jgi:WD40 repeat protein
MYSALDRGNNGVFPIRSIRRSGYDRHSYTALLNLGPEVVEFDVRGREIDRFSLQEGVSDIIHSPNGDFLYSSLRDGVIWRRDPQNDTHVFAHNAHYQPFSLSFFQDGRIVAGGPSYHKLNGNEHGAIIIYDQHGNLIREIVQSTDGLFVKFPVSISVSTSNIICVADKDSQCVFVFSDTGSIISLYDGRFGLEPLGVPQFLPYALCHDSEGHIIVANILDGMLHVLSSNGVFLGYVLTKNTEDTNRPSALCVDDENRICVGNMEDGGIRIYEISSFNNMLEEL